MLCGVWRGVGGWGVCGVLGVEAAKGGGRRCVGRMAEVGGLGKRPESSGKGFRSDPVAASKTALCGLSNIPSKLHYNSNKHSYNCKKNQLRCYSNFESRPRTSTSSIPRSSHTP